MYKAASIARIKLNIDSGIFLRFATDTAFIHSLGVPTEAKSAEGYLFPNTYRFIFTADPKTLIIRMIREWRRIVRDSILKQNPNRQLEVHQLMTLASIVEAEAKRKEERDTIAGVYVNRLQIGMKLDADPTVQYGLHLTRPITHADLQSQGAYNTYMNPGLPPGPINSPGAASIHAALYPAKHPYLYFVTRRDGSGGHYFSKSLLTQDARINESKKNSSIP